MQDARTLLTGAGSPEGLVTAIAGTCFLDANAQILYDKSKGSGATGWEIAIPAPVLKTATVTLSAAQLKSIGTTPVTLVSAQGAGKVINLVSWMMQYKAGATPFTTAGNLSVYYAADTTNSMGSENLAGFIDQATDQVFPSIPAGGLSFSASPAHSANQALVATTSDASNPTLGDGTLTVTVFYTVVTLS